MKISIIYFSSSGNTKYIANLIKKGLNYANLDSELIPYNLIRNKDLDFKEIEVIGIGAPIYAMAFSLNMLEWIKSLPRLNKKIKFFLFDTNAGLPGTSIKHVRKILEKKNFEFIGALEIVVPTRDSVFESKLLKHVKWYRKKIEKAFQFGIKLGNIIKKGKGVLDWSTPTFPTLFGIVIRAYFSILEKTFYKSTSKLIRYNYKECISCKSCEKGCPTEAIKFDKKPIINHESCILCFRCLRICPNNALYFKLSPNAKYFKGPKTVKGYIQPDDLLKEYQNKLINRP